jgi:hypothetical protein
MSSSVDDACANGCSIEELLAFKQDGISGDRLRQYVVDNNWELFDLVIAVLNDTKTNNNIYDDDDNCYDISGIDTSSSRTVSLLAAEDSLAFAVESIATHTRPKELYLMSCEKLSQSGTSLSVGAVDVCLYALSYSIIAQTGPIQSQKEQPADTERLVTTAFSAVFSYLLRYFHAQAQLQAHARTRIHGSSDAKGSEGSDRLCAVFVFLKQILLR